MQFSYEPSAYPRLYNAPNCSEVAAISQTVDGAPLSHRQITVYESGGNLKDIDHDSMHCEPMTYTLIWPYGEPGWHISMPTGGIRQAKIRHKLTMNEYVQYRIAVWGTEAPGDFNPIINASKLIQRIFVDYCLIEGDRLKFI
ncbi:hypothetical protein AVEN_84489-1 [Araneus ventricosus]|uniref:Helitron helicase-like domain-containing protein n=1 Tax=Araneus ventricosus TaxID=182803 RepID=A0A4Y2UFE0_ARAVE|nr:hypothetical protein AVEN_84489-1 [Araneus ventricosus]